MTQVYKEDDNTWELVKENAAPLERGRDINSIKKMFGESSALVSGEERERNERKKLQFEQLIRHSEVAWRDSDEEDSDDPLVPWLSYIKFVQETYPADTQQSFLLMERCTRAFIGKKRYMNDVRFIRVCILYADRTSSPMEVYKYLHSRKIGAKTALFWVAWAWVSEKAGDFQFADKIFRTALAKNANPRNILEERQRQFQRRMSRHWLNASSREGEESRIEDSDTALRRGRLNSITAPTLATSNYRLPAVLEEPNRGFSERSSNMNNATLKGSSTGKFSIYVDNSDNVDENSFHLDQAPPLQQKFHSKIATEFERKKENTSGAEQWSARGGLFSSALEEEEANMEVTVHRQRPAAPKFEIFVEVDENKETNVISSSVKAKKMETVSNRSIRERLEDNSLIGTLSKNPLHYIQNPTSYANDKEALERRKEKGKETNKRQDASSIKDATKRTEEISSRQLNFVQDKMTVALVEEQSLEELRAEKGFYRIASGQNDFSLLITRINAENESFMSLDEKDCSVNNSIEVENSSQCFPESSLKNGGSDENVMSPYTKTNQFMLSTSVNESHASSTFNDIEAIGGLIKTEDETINTKFARVEMSLMFSSPAEQDALFSSASKPLLLPRQSSMYGVDSSVLDISAIPPTESHHKAFSSRTMSRSTPNQDGCTASFSVFGDLMDEVGMPLESEKKDKVSRNIKFSIFEDSFVTEATHEKNERHELTLSHAEVHGESVGYSLALIVLGKNVLDRRDVLLPAGLNQSKPVLGQTISLPNDSFLVHHELGRGAHGTVLFCSNLRDEFVALKVQSPTGCLAHEFQILSSVEKRLKPKGESKVQSINIFPRPLHFVAHGDGSLLSMTTASRSGINLIDLVNIYHKFEGGRVPELLALFYVSKMLHCVAKLHSRCFILHCDIKPDNWVLTKLNDSDAVEGSDLMLVDFGRAVDLEALNSSSPLTVKFVGPATLKDMECISMRENKPWSLDLDTYGLCASAYVLLFGSHMEVCQESSTKLWKTTKPLRRYWNRTLWSLLFETLLNGGIEESQPKRLNEIRCSFDEYLNEKNRRREVQALLRHQATMLPKSKNL